MALKTDYVDAVFLGNRKYNMVTNSDGTYSFVDVTDYEVDGDYYGAEDVNATNLTVNSLDSALTNGSVTRLGTISVGSATQPVFLSSGYPTALTTTVGGAAKPIYSNAGVLTACSSTVGSATQPVYMSSGTITSCNAMLPLSGGTMTGQFYAYNNTNYTISQVRNIEFSTSVPTSLNNGTICMVYST